VVLADKQWGTANAGEVQEAIVLHVVLFVLWVLVPAHVQFGVDSCLEDVHIELADGLVVECLPIPEKVVDVDTDVVGFGIWF
jgi:hypothetical protein